MVFSDPETFPSLNFRGFFLSTGSDLDLGGPDGLSINCIC
jgi:hypothetical protein